MAERICGNCVNFVKSQGTAYGKCRIRKFLTSRNGGLTDREFIPARSRRACKNDFEPVGETEYIIISKPDYIKFDCPHCGENAKVDFSEVDFKTDYWGDGAWVNCPECNKEVELGNFEYE